MDQPFDAKEFVAQLQQGVFDGRVNLEFRKLSHEQLEQVAILLANRGQGKTDGSS
jgi:hypothetical protein